MCYLFVCFRCVLGTSLHLPPLWEGDSVGMAWSWLAADGLVFSVSSPTHTTSSTCCSCQGSLHVIIFIATCGIWWWVLHLGIFSLWMVLRWNFTGGTWRSLYIVYSVGVIKNYWHFLINKSIIDFYRFYLWQWLVRNAVDGGSQCTSNNITSLYLPWLYFLPLVNTESCMEYDTS